jgi:intracellular septation protein
MFGVGPLPKPFPEGEGTTNYSLSLWERVGRGPFRLISRPTLRYSVRQYIKGLVIIMKLLFDFFPVILFFIAFKLYGMSVGIIVAMVAVTVQLAAFWLRHRHFETMQLITAGLIISLGGISLLYHNELFFKWKPTAVNWIFAVVFIASQWIGQKPLIQRLMEKNVSLPNAVWRRLNMTWISFFILMGGANLYVVYHYSTDTWVNFKLFGVLGLTLVFILAQAIYLAKHMEESTSHQ